MVQVEGEKGYKAFISYSHKDAAWANWLLNALEGYRLPVDLVVQIGRKRGIGRVFRDRDEASAAGDLADEIQRALFASEHLIVVASPNSARSRYVEAEIQAFAAHNATREVPGSILVLIAEGEPNISPLEGEMAIAECFPRALRGGLRKPGGAPVEPLAADARHTGDGKTRALAKLVAGLLGVSYARLVRRDLQRRRRAQLLTAAAVVLVLGVAGAVATVMISGNIERERIEFAQKAAELSFRTVTAVNNAERARREFASNNFADAVALARTSLPDDGSLPFIPQAYGVLYRALYEGREALPLDFSPGDALKSRTYEMANGQFFSADARGTAMIWSPTKGAIFTRDDLDINTATMSPDGSVVFVPTYSSVLRYHASDGRWDEIDVTGFYTDDPNIHENIMGQPDSYTAIDANTLVGCGGTVLRVVSLPEREGTASLQWTQKLDELNSSCNVLEVTPQYTLMLSGFYEKVLELDLKTREVLHRYDTGDRSILWSRSAGKVVVVGSTLAIQVFDRESARLLLSFKESGVPSIVSDGGRYIVETGSLSGSGSNTMTIHDLETGSTTLPPCGFCRPVGFLDETTLLALNSDSRQIVPFEATTGLPKDGGFTFSQPVESAQIFGRSRTLMGIRTAAQSMVAVLAQSKAEPTLVSAPPGAYLIGAIFAGPDTVASAVSHAISGGKMQATVHLYRSGAGGKEIPSPELNAETGYSELSRLPYGFFSVFEPTNIGETAGRYRIFEAKSGKLVLEKSITARPARFGSGRYLLLSEAGDFGVFDLEHREFKQISAGTGAGIGAAWSVNGSYLATAQDAIIRTFSLGDDGPRQTATLTLDAPPINVCITPDGSFVYAVDYTVDPPILRRISVATGKEEARIVMDYSQEAGKELATVLLDTMVPGASKSPYLDCTNDRAVIRDEMASLAAVWAPSVAVQKVITMSLADADPPPLPDGNGSQESLSPDQFGSVIFTSSDMRLSLRDHAARQPLLTLDSEASRIASSAWVRSRGLAAAGLDNGRLQVWDTTSASAPMIDIQAHGQPISTIDVSADDKWLLTGDHGGTIKLWPLLTTPELLKASENGSSYIQ